MTTLAAPTGNEIQNTLAATYERGVDTDITLTDGADFPSSAHVIRISESSTKWCLIIYTTKATHVLTMGGGAADYALANNYVTDGTAVFAIGSTVELVCAADEIAQLFANKMDDLVDDTAPQLGASLDVNAHSIVSASNNDIPLTPNGTGRTIIAAPSETVTSLDEGNDNDVLTIAQAGIILLDAGTAFTLVLPTASGNAGLRYHFIKTDNSYNLITLDGDGTETFNHENSTGAPALTYLRLNTYCAEVTVVSDGANWQCINEQMGQKPECFVYLGTNQLAIPDNSDIRVELDTDTVDIGGSFDLSTWHSGNMTSRSADELVDSGATFSNAGSEKLVGCRIENTTDSTYAYITAVTDANTLVLSSDIFDAVGEPWDAYEIMHAKFVVPISGTYLIRISMLTDSNTTVADIPYYIKAFSDGSAILSVLYQTSIINGANPAATFTYKLAADEIVEMITKNKSGGDTIQLFGNIAYTYLSILLLFKD